MRGWEPAARRQHQKGGGAFRTPRASSSNPLCALLPAHARRGARSQRARRAQPCAQACWACGTDLRQPGCTRQSAETSSTPTTASPFLIVVRYGCLYNHSP